MKIADVQRRLASKYAQFPPEEISTIVRSAHQKFAQSPIRDVVPLFVERNTQVRLAKLQTFALSQ
jgi:hypothetical protein